MSFSDTEEQKAIYDHIRGGRGNLIIDAKAGCGKTTTIVRSLEVLPMSIPGSYLPPNICFVAFGKDIVTELKRKVPKRTLCATFNALGFRAWKQHEPKCVLTEDKCYKLLWEACDRDFPDTRNTLRLVSIAKLQQGTVTLSDMRDFADEYNLIFEDEDAPSYALETLHRSDRDLLSVDFDDMIRFPLKYDVKFPEQDFVFVDELQDVNNIQIEILKRLLKPSSVFVGVGDPNQAIYGFRGANAAAMQRVREEFSCTVMPLSTTFRCSKAVVREALKYLNPISITKP